MTDITCMPQCLFDCGDVFCDSFSRLAIVCGDSENIDAVEQQCLNAFADRETTVTEMSFNLSMAFKGFTAAEYAADQFAHNATSNAISSTMKNVKHDDVTFINAFDLGSAQEASRLLQTYSARTMVVFEVRVTIEVLGFRSTDSDVAYSSLTRAFISAVDIGLVIKKLQQTGLPIFGTPLFQNNTVVTLAASADPYSVIYIQTASPTFSPTSAPTQLLQLLSVPIIRIFVISGLSSLAVFIFLILVWFSRKNRKLVKYRESTIAVIDNDVYDDPADQMVVNVPLEVSETSVFASSTLSIEDDAKTIASSSSLIERQALHRVKLPPISGQNVKLIAGTEIRAGRWKRRHIIQSKRSSPGHASDSDKDIFHAVPSDNIDFAQSFTSKPTLWRKNGRHSSRRPPGGGYGQIDLIPNSSMDSEKFLGDSSVLRTGRSPSPESKFEVSDRVTAFDGLISSPVKQSHTVKQYKSSAPGNDGKNALNPSTKEVENLLLDTFQRRVGSRRKRRPVTSGKFPGPGDWDLELDEDVSQFDIPSAGDNSPTRGPGASRVHFPSVIIKKISIPTVHENNNATRVVGDIRTDHEVYESVLRNQLNTDRDKTREFLHM